MKRTVRFIAVVLMLVFSFTMILGCSKKDEPNQAVQTKSDTPEYLNPTGMPIVNQPTTLNILVNKSANHTDFDKMLVWQEYEKMTGIKVNWEMVSQNLNERINILLASNDQLPDIFLKTNMSVDNLINYGSQNVFVGINDLVDKYAVNIKKAFEKYPDVKKGLTMPDGKIYSLPYLDDNPDTQIRYKLHINQKWLEKIGKKMPTTTMEVYEILKAFKEKDPNGNGKNDEVPMTAPYGIRCMVDFFAGSYGIQNRGMQNIFFDLDEKTNKLRFMPIENNYRELLQFLNKLYAEGLLDNDIFTLKSTQFTAKAEENLIGTAPLPNTVLLGSKYEADYLGVSTLLKGPNGEQGLSAVTPQLRIMGSFILTKACKYPEAAIRWVDYFYSEEGVRLFFMGVEGKTYNVVNGKYQLIDEIVKNPKGLSFDQALGQYLAWGGGNNPTIITDKYFTSGLNDEKSKSLSRELSKFMPKEVWPSFVFTKEENTKLATSKADITTYVNEMLAQFVSGKVSFSEWDNYVKQIKQMGLDEYMKIYQDAFDRYSKVK